MSDNDWVQEGTPQEPQAADWAAEDNDYGIPVEQWDDYSAEQAVPVPAPGQAPDVEREPMKEPSGDAPAEPQTQSPEETGPAAQDWAESDADGAPSEQQPTQEPVQEGKGDEENVPFDGGSAAEAGLTGEATSDGVPHYRSDPGALPDYQPEPEDGPETGRIFVAEPAARPEPVVIVMPERVPGGDSPSGALEPSEPEEESRWFPAPDGVPAEEDPAQFPEEEETLVVASSPADLVSAESEFGPWEVPSAPAWDTVGQEVPAEYSQVPRSEEYEDYGVPGANTPGDESVQSDEQSLAETQGEEPAVAEPQDAAASWEDESDTSTTSASASDGAASWEDEPEQPGVDEAVEVDDSDRFVPEARPWDEDSGPAEGIHTSAVAGDLAVAEPQGVDGAASWGGEPEPTAAGVAPVEVTEAEVQPEASPEDVVHPGPLPAEGVNDLSAAGSGEMPEANPIAAAIVAPSHGPYAPSPDEVPEERVPFGGSQPGASLSSEEHRRPEDDVEATAVRHPVEAEPATQRARPIEVPMPAASAPHAAAPPVTSPAASPVSDSTSEAMAKLYRSDGAPQAADDERLKAELAEEERLAQQVEAERKARAQRLGTVATSEANAVRDTATVRPRGVGAFGSFGLLLVRLAVAGLAGVVGYQILSDIDASTQFLQQTLLPEPRLMAWIAGFTLFAIALFLVIGLAVRVVGLLLAVVAVCALAFIRWGAFSPFVAGMDGFLGDRDLLVAVIGLLFLTIGGGRFGIDGAIAKSRAQRRESEGVTGA